MNIYNSVGSVGLTRWLVSKVKVGHSDMYFFIK